MNDLYEQFFRAYSSVMPMKSVFTEAIPREMLKSTQPNPGGYVDWKLIRQTASLGTVFENLERKTGLKFPESFKSWFGMYYTLDLDCGVVRLPQCPSNNPTGELQELIFHSYRPERIVGTGLLPFGEEAMMDAGPLCFDTRAPDANSEWPVVYWDHEWVGTDKEVSPPIFSSFDKLIACCTVFLESGTVHDFSTIDPQGAGSTGRAYWSMWTDGGLE